tara:strand:+ start:10087 stop:10548 length:462 start_codon:yes stop_codon:yes gene_type:complete
MTKEELKEMSDFNKRQLYRQNEVRNWALELGWKFDTKMAYLNYYIPNTNYRYEPTCSDWMSEKREIFDCIYKTTESMDWNKEEIYFKGIIKNKEDLESKMKEFGIPITKLETTGVINQMMYGKGQDFTKEQLLEFKQTQLNDLLLNIEINKLH